MPIISYLLEVHEQQIQQSAIRAANNLKSSHWFSSVLGLFLRLREKRGSRFCAVGIGSGAALGFFLSFRLSRLGRFGSGVAGAITLMVTFNHVDAVALRRGFAGPRGLWATDSSGGVTSASTGFFGLSAFSLSIALANVSLSDAVGLSGFE